MAVAKPRPAPEPPPPDRARVLELLSQADAERVAGVPQNRIAALSALADLCGTLARYVFCDRADATHCTARELDALADGLTKRWNHAH